MNNATHMLSLTLKYDSGLLPKKVPYKEITLCSDSQNEYTLKCMKKFHVHYLSALSQITSLVATK